MHALSCIFRYFSEKAVEQIRQTTFRDVILATTNLTEDDLPQDVFQWKTGRPNAA